MTLTNPDGKETFRKEESVSELKEGGNVLVMGYSDVPDGPAIVELKLLDPSGKVLSVNRYMRNFSGGKDTGDYRSIVGKFTL